MIVLEVDDCVPEVDDCVPEVDNCVPEVDDCVPELDNCVLEVDNCVADDGDSRPNPTTAVTPPRRLIDRPQRSKAAAIERSCHRKHIFTNV